MADKSTTFTFEDDYEFRRAEGAVAHQGSERVAMSQINLWLDDVRPAPVGWVHAKTVEEAKKILTEFHVVEASLDHDLGACSECLDGLSPEEWLVKTAFSSMPHCEHFGTGYTLVCWMEETGIWPEKKPMVHSANPSGGMRMRAAIDHSFRRG